MGVLALCLFFLAPPPSPLSFPFLSGLQHWWELTPRRGEPFLPLLGQHRAVLSRGLSGPHAMMQPLLLPAAPPAGVRLLLAAFSLCPSLLPPHRLQTLRFGWLGSLGGSFDLGIAGVRPTYDAELCPT